MATLTYKQVIAITGKSGLDDKQIADIIGTGASEAEVVEAWEWSNQADDVMGSLMHRPLTGRVAEVFNILVASRPVSPDER